MNKKKPEIRSRFTESPPVNANTVGESLTQQQFAKEADINFKARQHLAGPNRMHPMGNPAATRVMRFADCTANDFQVMQNTLATVQAKFMGLPSRLRTRFSNRPDVMMTWLEKPENRDEALKLGLVTPTLEDHDRQMDLIDQANRAGELADMEEFRKWKESMKKGGAAAGTASDPEANPRK